ncbi:MAG: RluA family pseudouridine synthase [Dehalococcoidia bacterium]
MTAPASVTAIVATVQDRLDRVVTAAMPPLSRSQARRLIEEGHVQVEGVTAARASTVVPAGAQIRVAQPVVADLEAAARDVPLHVLYEDEETLVLDKQPGIIVHPREGVPEVTLIHAVRARYPEVRLIDESDRGGVVHRLDRDTSGVIVFAKSEASQYTLKEQWRQRETTKQYLAIVEGDVEPAEGIIDAPLGPDPTDPRRRAVVERGQSARSSYRVLEQYGDEAALLLVRIYTGRTHQIRVHMQAVGHPVIADRLYGQESSHIDRQALHAWRLGVTLASNGATKEFVAPMPDDLRHAVRALRARHHATPSKQIGALE